jgi:homoserine trans-succinylase
MRETVTGAMDSLVQSEVCQFWQSLRPSFEAHNSSWERTVRICWGMAEVSVSSHVVQLTKDNNLLAMHAGERV